MYFLYRISGFGLIVFSSDDLGLGVDGVERREYRDGKGTIRKGIDN